MSDIAINSFLPWLRKGISASIGRTDDTSNQGAYAGFNVELGFNSPSGGNPSLKEHVTISLYGPGEITGLDRQTISRTWPRADVVDAEANFFPMIEFSQVDLPWRYTPARASRPDRLKPWIALIALRDDEIEKLEPASPDHLLPVVTVKDGKTLPDLDQSGAWAHVQVSGSKIDDIDKAAEILAKYPHSAVSRLLCPRRMDNLTRYTAFLVPAFERGRLAGLGLPTDENIDALEKAWDENDRLLQIPVYYMWSFRTGPLGDFEYLVTLLEPYAAGSDVGYREMDVKSPGLGLPQAADSPMLLDGALISNATVTVPPIKGEFIEEIVAKLNLPADFLELGKPKKSVVAPPLYGQVYADRYRLSTTIKADTPWEPPDEETNWFWNANIDPIRRVAAGLGTQVIQANQQQLMASAWEQVEAIRRANRDIRFAQLSMEISGSTYGRNIKSQKTENAIFLTAPSQSRTVASWSISPSGLKQSMIIVTQPPPTAVALLKRSSISKGALDTQWRRRSSPLGAIGRRQGRPDLESRQDFLKRMGNDLENGGLAASRPPITPDSVLPFTEVKKPPIITIKGPVRDRDLTATGTIDQAIDIVLKALNLTPKDEEIQGFTSDNLDALALNIIKDLEPKKNIAWGVKRRLSLTDDIIPPDTGLKLASSGPLGDEDELKPVMRAPEFPRPVYEDLRDLSQDWILPGIEHLPENSVSLLKANQRFIEAFMLGLNHEMARELLWNGYPTDMRGTYFAQFWDSSGTISHPPIPAEKQKDINPFYLWDDNDLGKNTARELTGDNILVLLIRGELFKRYPNTIVYAVNAVKKKDDSNTNILEIGSDEMHPIFSGKLNPDVSFFGFNLTAEVARGTNGDPGWFFVLQEQPSEPQFGLDVATEDTIGSDLADWTKASWGHLVDQAEDLERIVYIDLDADRPKVTAPGGIKWIDGGSSDLAYATYQLPVRVAFYARVMLPKS